MNLPVFGFGTYNLTGLTCYELVKEAIHIGYKMIDTATLYGNHIEVGKAIKDSGVDRSKIFITTKVHRRYMSGTHDFNESIKNILSELELDYVDMLLLHQPFRHKNIDRANKQNIINWKNMERFVDFGYCRYIGISNFKIEEVQNIL